MTMIISANHHHSKQQYLCSIDYRDNIELLESVDYVVYGLRDPRTLEVYAVVRTQNFAQRLKQNCYVSTERSSPQERRKIEIFEAGLHTQVVIFHITEQAKVAVQWKAKKEEEHRDTILSNRRPSWYSHRVC